jgi:hypothetical protein
MPELEKDVSACLSTSHQTTAVIIDGMALIQMLKTGKTATFGELAKKHFDIITSGLGNGCNRVDVVFDQYRSTSIKSGERERREASSAMEDLRTDDPNSKAMAEIHIQCIKHGFAVRLFVKLLDRPGKGETDK